MNSPEHREPELYERLSHAIQQAEHCITETGQIDYTAIAPARFEALKDVGLVQELSEQDPTHLLPEQKVVDKATGQETVVMTAAQVFCEQCGNFSAHFITSSVAGQLYRRQAHARRFQALFSEFDQALVALQQHFLRLERE